MTLDELIEALEKADASQEHDLMRAAVHMAYVNSWISDQSHDHAVLWVQAGATMDAALTLVPEGWQWLVRSDEEKGCLANLHRDHECPNRGYEYFPAWAHTPVLAITLACMKARKP